VARYEWHKTDLNNFPNVKRWFDAIAARPPVQRGMAVPAPLAPSPSARA
jgi:GST-like protein